MAITGIRCAITCVPKSLPCGSKKRMIARVSVWADTNTGGGSYDVYVYDEDTWPDTKLAQSLKIKVPANKTGRLKTHKFRLRCKKDCTIRGSSGSTNKTASIFGYVNAGGGIKANSTDTAGNDVTIAIACKSSGGGSKRRRRH